MEYRLQDSDSTTGRTASLGKDVGRALSLDDLVVRKREPASIEEVMERTLQLKQLLKESVTQREKGDIRDVANSVKHVLEVTKLVGILLENFDSLIVKDSDKVSQSCPEELGRLFFPGLVQTWDKRAVSPQEKLLSELTGRYLETGNPDRLKELSPSEFLLTSQFLFALHYNSSKFPDAEYFARLSQEKAPQIKFFDTETEQIQTKLAGIQEMNSKSLERTGRAMYESQEGILSAKLAESRDRVAELLPEISDVSPMDAVVAMRSVAPDIVVAPTLLSEILRAQVALERLIVLTIAPPKNQESFKIYVPCIKDRKIATHSIEIGKDACDALAQNPEILSGLLRDLIELRTCARDLISRSLKHPSYTEEARNAVKEFLQEPFKKVVKGHHQVLARLIEHQSPLVQIEACNLASQAIPLDPSMQKWGYVLENPQNMRILEAASRAFLTSANHAVVQAAREVMSVSKTTQSCVLSPLENVRKVIDKKQLYSLGITFDNALQQAETRRRPLESLAILTGLQVFGGDSDLCPYVKQQLPNVHLVKQLVEDISRAHEEIEAKVRDLGRIVTKSLSHSLSDYYLDENGTELKEFIDDYMYYVKNPDALMGVSGNVGVRSAMLIYGEPGTGKTYFVECLENEVGVPCRVLSASEKEKGEDKLDYLKKVIDDVKAKKSPCILLIDEAESTVLDRTSPMASSEDRHVTNYLLQEINELRKNHPYVLIVVATNYIDRIDDAILRPGRVDIIIEMKPMSEKGRKALILRELIKEKIELELEPSDWEELMSITEGFIPICISQAIIGTNRIYLPRIRRSDPDAVFDKELLFQKLKEESARYGRFKNLIRDRDHRR